MRIIGGTVRGRKLLAPGRRFGRRLRPTSDRAREALFNIIGARVAGARVLDLFAGTGALGLEALSRGARFAVFVDGQREALRLIQANIERCGFLENAVTVKHDLAKGLVFSRSRVSAGGFDLVFLDPPYGHGLVEKLLKELAAAGTVQSGGLVAAEAAAQEELPLRVGCFSCVDRRRYGAVGFWMYRREEERGDE